MVDVDKLTNRSECTRLVDITRRQNRKFLPGSKISNIPGQEWKVSKFQICQGQNEV